MTLQLEIRGWERFQNRRQIGSYTGLCPGIHHSNGRGREGCINRCGNPVVRYTLVEMTWRLLRWQPDYPPIQKLRGAMHSGVVHYLVKPFTFATFRERLESYAALRARLERLHLADQYEIDRLYSLLRANSQGALPKGISPPTLTLVADVVRQAGDDVSATDVAGSAGLSRGTARRYLEFLADSGTLELTLRYGAAGRPEHLYRWVAAKV